MQKKKKFERVLIANRGEIAVRVARTLREMDITAIAIYSDADRTAPHVRACDIAYHIGPAPAAESYLCADKVLDIAKRSKADAIHPGYGFLSENADFAEAVEAAGIAFIGPPSSAIRKMGSKTEARRTMVAAGVPTVPGNEAALTTEEEAAKVADSVGYPVMLKASAGGGGKGMRAVESAADLASALRATRSEARNAFGDDTVYLEKLILKPRHVEIQVLSGADGKAIWLGDRECSMQRRHQKVIEETPSPAIDEKTRCAMGEVACRAAEAVNYVGAGTVEFLVDKDKNFYFLEMNTRLQVEHAVTEMCCGIDMVAAQVRIAEGAPLAWKQEDIRRSGFSMEARIYAEDPNRGFLPSPGHIDDMLLPDGLGIRVDCGVTAHYEVPRHYDPMIAKVVVWEIDREGARKKLARALRETVFKGIKTNARFLRRLINQEGFIAGDYNTGSIAEMQQSPPPEVPSELNDVAMAAMAIRRFRNDREAARDVATSETGRGGNWRSPGWRMRGL